MIFNEENDEESGMKHTINGRIFGNLSGYNTHIGERVHWHLIALGNEKDNHTIHWHGQTILHYGRRTDVIEINARQHDLCWHDSSRVRELVISLSCQ